MENQSLQDLFLISRKQRNIFMLQCKMHFLNYGFLTFKAVSNQTLKINRLLLLLFSICISFTTYATDYYVSSTGNDSNAGTSSATAWQSLSKVNGFSFSAGDRIFLEGGKTFSGNLSLGSDDTGSSSNPIVIDSYGTGVATINAGSNTGVYILNTSGISVKNLIIKGGWDSGSQSGNNGSGVHLNNNKAGNIKLSFIRLSNIDVNGFKNTGILIEGSASDNSKSGFNDVKLTNCLVHDNGDNGVITAAPYTSSMPWAHTNITATYCKFYNNKGFVNKGSHTGSGIILNDVDGGTIERCIAYNNGENNDLPGGGPYGIWAWNANNINIQYNEAYNNKTKTADGGGFDFDGGVSNSVMQYNYAHDNAGAGIGMFQFNGAAPYHNVTVRYNISERDGKGIYFWDGTGTLTDVYVYNNVFYASRGPAINAISSLKNVNFYNNILYTANNNTLIDLSDVNGITFKGNDYWTSGGTFKINWGGTNYSSLSAWRSATGQESTNGVSQGYNFDPLFTSAGSGTTIGNTDLLNTLSAYKLLAGSPMIDAGLNLKSLFGIDMGTKDFYGNNIPAGSGYDIGAYEAGSTTTTPPPPVTSYSINAGGGATGTFATDAYVSGGNTYNVTSTIDVSGAANPAPTAVYQSERWGPSTYTFPSLTAGKSYTVRLHFAEIFFNAAGKRKFNVDINGTRELTDFDVFAAAGANNKAVVKEYTITPNSSNQIIIAFTNGALDNAKISGIEVFPATSTSTTFSGYYKLTAKHSGKVLDVDQSSTADGATVKQYTSNGTDAQKWLLEDVGGGYYSLKARCSGKALDVNGGPTATGNGVKVQQWTYGGGDNQKWKIDSVGGGYYKLTAKHSGKCLDISGGVGATGDGALANQWDYLGADNQKWALTYISATGAREASATGKKVENTEPALSNFNVYPNPASSTIHLSYIAVNDEDIAVHLYDTQGILIKTVFNGRVLKGTTNNYTVNGETLKEGMYIVKLNTPSSTINKKVILTR